MTPDFLQELVGLIQGIAIAHSAWRGTDQALADFIVRALERDFSQAELDDVRRLLHSQPLQAVLASRDVALWVGHDKLLRLVDQSPSSKRAAILRTQHHPGPSCCRYCLMREPNSLQPELEAERAPSGELLQGSMLHPRCANAWAKLKLQAERE